MHSFNPLNNVPTKIFLDFGTNSNRYKYPTVEIPAPPVPKTKISANVRKNDFERIIPKYTNN